MKNYYLPRNVVEISNKVLKDLFDLKKWFKFVADTLHIPYIDDCCDTNKTTAPVRFNTETGFHEYYDLNTDNWIEFGDSGSGGLDAGEATTPHGTTLDWGGIITHDVAINSDGVVPLPSIIFGNGAPFRTFEVNCNDFDLVLNDTLDVRCEVINFVSAISSNVDCPIIQCTSGGTTMLELDKANKQYSLGDLEGVDNSTLIMVDDTARTITLSANTAIKIPGLLNFANNAAAITGGLTVGTLYRNNDVLQIVH